MDTVLRLLGREGQRVPCLSDFPLGSILVLPGTVLVGSEGIYVPTVLSTPGPLLYPTIQSTCLFTETTLVGFKFINKVWSEALTAGERPPSRPV